MKRHVTATAIAAALLLTIARPVCAADAGRGELLYQNHCTVCHTSVVHLREKRIASSTAQVRAQVLRWSTHLKLDWGGDDLADVTQFLVNRYYRFESHKQN